MLALLSGAVAVTAVAQSHDHVQRRAARTAGSFGATAPHASRTGQTAAQVVPQTAHDVSGPLATAVPPPGTPLPKPELERHRRQPTPRPQRDPVVQTEPVPNAMPAPVVSIEGLANSLNSPKTIPPDVEGDVGPNHYVEFVNNRIAAWTKTGTPIFTKPDGAIWAGFPDTRCTSGPLADPIVLYDQLADRWLVAEIVYVSPFRLCVAVSTSPDPGGTYNRYSYAFARLPDYPKIGVWPDGYYVSVNLDGFNTGAAALDRVSMLAGASASMLLVDEAGGYGMLPTDLDGTATPSAGSPNVFLQYADDGFGYPADALQVWKFQATWGGSPSGTFTHATDVATAPFDSDLCGASFTACIPQKDTAQRLDAIPDLLMYRLSYRRFAAHESLVVNHTVDVGADRAGIRWYELRNPFGAPTIQDQGTFAPNTDSESRWVGSIAIDSSGDIALGYNASSASTYPSIRYAGRLAADPAGQLAQGEGTLEPGLGSQTPSPPGGFVGAENRWGDYSTLSVDPADGCTFWYAGEYHGPSNESDWRTKIRSFKFSTCGAATAASVEAFSSRWSKAGVTSTWRTASEAATAGFHLWRTGRDGIARCVNARLIRARFSGRARGAAYRLVDRTLKRGAFATYRLQTVGLDGKRAWYGVGSAPAK